MPGATYIAAIDQGTTSTRCMIFDRGAAIIAEAHREHRQIYPRPGWVEHDAVEIREATDHVVREAVERAGGSGRIAAVGVTNQRETVVFWNRHTGAPYGNAIVWQDVRTQALCRELAGDVGPDRFVDKTGLPLATYFSGTKIRWALDHVDGLADAAARGEAICGTIESWVIWNITGGARSGRHVTDVTNASRTQLMDLRTLAWDDELLDAFGVPRSMLPEIVPCVEPAGWGTTMPDGPFGGAVPVCGAVGDQQAAMIGQCCFAVGDAKNTYGTGCFMLLNTGGQIVRSHHGLLTTVACQVRGAPPVYALEGSVAIAGALVQWLRDNLGIIDSAADIEPLAASVPDTGGVYIVPAFSGLFAPYWRDDARGVVTGLTRFADKAHVARAALEATCWQTFDVLEAMQADAGLELTRLKVDGGMAVNDLLMQMQADVLGVTVVRPRVFETTALGAAYAAGLAIGVYDDLDQLTENWQEDRTWEPTIDAAARDARLHEWRKAVDRSLGWAE